MNKYPQEMHSTVLEALQKYPEFRDSDIKLYRYILNKFYGTCDLNQINLESDIFISIKRCRQKIQETNPFLSASSKVKEYRQENLDKYLDYVRNW